MTRKISYESFNGFPENQSIDIDSKEEGKSSSSAKSEKSYLAFMHSNGPEMIDNYLNKENHYFKSDKQLFEIRIVKY